MNTRTGDRLEEYVRWVSDGPQSKLVSRQVVRDLLSDILGGNPRDYALVTSTGVGMGIAAGGYEWQPGDNVVLPMDEHWNATFPWLALKDRGVEVRLVPVGEDQRINPEVVARHVDENTRILATTAVRFNTGFRSDLRRLGRIIHDRDGLLVVDGIQGAGVVPINVENDTIDVFCAAGFKWLLGMHGCGLMYVNARARERIRPVIPGMFAAKRQFRELQYLDDARKYETGNFAYSLFHAWPGGLGLIQELGIENIHTRILKLTDQIIAGLKEKGIRIVSPVDAIHERSAILSFTVGTEEENNALHKRLLEQKVITTFREGIVRVAPNFYNTEEEVARFLSLI